MLTARLLETKRTQNFFLPSSHKTNTHVFPTRLEQLIHNASRSVLLRNNTTQYNTTVLNRFRTDTHTHQLNSSASKILHFASSPPTRNWPVYDNDDSPAPSCKGSPLPRTHLQSHHQVKRYICVICISHPTPTTSDTSRLSSCNHFAYRGNLVAPTSVATANPPPLSRMSR
jgi:hypothetical protein